MNEKLNIPICRAKKIDSDEYVEGFYLPALQNYEDFIKEPIDTIFIRTLHDVEDPEYGYFYHQEIIDPSTLAIHFPDMIDSEGTRIFASLSDSGNGGDKCSYLYTKDMGQYDAKPKVCKQFTTFKKDGFNLQFVYKDYQYSDLKVTGIQE